MKEIINKVKRKSTERGKIFANHKSDKGSDPNILVRSRYCGKIQSIQLKIYKELVQLNISKDEVQLKNKQRTEQTFFQKRQRDGQHDQLLEKCISKPR